MARNPLRSVIREMALSSGDEGQKLDENDPYQRVKFFYEFTWKNMGKGIDTLIRPHLKLISVDVDPLDPSTATSIFEFTVPEILTNNANNLHGGAVAVVFDFTTSLTVVAVSREDHWDTGHVTRSLSCQYLRPAPMGSVLVVESKVVSLGKSLGLLEGKMRRKDDGKICYTCVHDKVQVVSKI